MTDIGLNDIVSFIVRRIRTLLIGLIFGVALAVLYVAVTPSVYLAKWDFQVAQFVDIKNGDNVMVNSEEPSELVQRLVAPTTYSEQVKRTCGVAGNEERLDGMLKTYVIKNINDTVKMELYAKSPSMARQCANAISSLLKQQEADLIRGRLAGRESQLARYEKSLEAEASRLAKIKNHELSGFSYLATLDELRWLRAQIDALKNVQTMSQMFPAKPTSPVYVSGSAVRPKISLSLLLGAVFGLLVGVLLGAAKDYFSNSFRS